MSFEIFGPGAVGTMHDARKRAEAKRAARAEQDQLLIAALGHQAGRRWLERMLEEEARRPSYVPGDSFDATAWREGRKAILRETLAQLDRALQPDQMED